MLLSLSSDVDSSPGWSRCRKYGDGFSKRTSRMPLPFLPPATFFTLEVKEIVHSLHFESDPTDQIE